MTGSTPFSIEDSDNFKRSFKQLAKTHGSDFVEVVAHILEALIEEQYPLNSRNEPLPGKIDLPEGCSKFSLIVTIQRNCLVLSAIG